MLCCFILEKKTNHCMCFGLVKWSLNYPFNYISILQFTERDNTVLQPASALQTILVSVSVTAGVMIIVTAIAICVYCAKRGYLFKFVLLCLLH